MTFWLIFGEGLFSEALIFSEGIWPYFRGAYIPKDFSGESLYWGAVIFGGLLIVYDITIKDKRPSCVELV